MILLNVTDFTMLCTLFRSSPTSQKVLKKMIKNDKFNVVSMYKLCVNGNCECGGQLIYMHSK